MSVKEPSSLDLDVRYGMSLLEKNDLPEANEMARKIGRHMQKLNKLSGLSLSGLGIFMAKLSSENTKALLELTHAAPSQVSKV